MHPTQCACGSVQGRIEGSGVHNRGICCCTDCRAFARFLGRATEVLDAQGRVSIIGLVHSCLDAERLNDDFGTAVVVVHANSALGSTKPRMGFWGPPSGFSG